MTQLSHLQASFKHYKSKPIRQNLEMRAKNLLNYMQKLRKETLKFEKSFLKSKVKTLMKFDISL